MARSAPNGAFYFSDDTALLPREDWPGATLEVAGLPDTGRVDIDLLGQETVILACTLEGDAFACSSDNAVASSYDAFTDVARWDFFAAVPDRLRVVHDDATIHDAPIPWVADEYACCPHDDAQVEL